MRNIILLASALVLFCGATAFAQEAEPAPDCDNAMTQADMNACAADEYKQADVELNDAYRKAVAAAQTMDDDARDMGEQYVGAVDALKRAQRAWIGYRDGQCELAGFAMRGGTAEPLLVSGCLADLTRKRTAELKAVYEQEN